MHSRAEPRRASPRLSCIVAVLFTLGCGTSVPASDSGASHTQRESNDGMRASPVSSTALLTATPGKGLAVDVTVKSLILRGDTVGITYALYIRPESRDSLSVFAVDAPAGVTSIPNPQPKTKWWVSPRFQGEDIAYWASLGSLPPATTGVPLYFESVGLPSIVTHWTVGHFPVPEGEGDDTTSHNSLRDNAVKGKTVGVERFASDRTPQALLTRLRSLTQATCTSPLLWVTDSLLCGKLLSAIDQAVTDHSSGRTAETKRSLDHYRGFLAVQRQGALPERVTSAAFWLLRSNADIIGNML